jgi:hypothetical protein
MTETKKIKDLTEREFIDLIQGVVKTNHIEVGGVSVNSSTDNLKSVEETIDRLLLKHEDFLLMRKENQIKTNYLG